MGKILDEIKEITSTEVAKKQDAAKSNLPFLIERIKASAKRGESDCIIPLNQMDEFHKRLLESEGFSVRLQDAYKDPFDSSEYSPQRIKANKEWVIRW